MSRYFVSPEECSRHQIFPGVEIATAARHAEHRARAGALQMRHDQVRERGHERVMGLRVSSLRDREASKVTKASKEGLEGAEGL